MTRTRTAAAVVAALGAGTLALTACGGSPDRADRLDPDVAFVGVVDPGWHGEAMVDASGRLASELLARADGNAVVSPLSLQLALALLREGATGAVADDIDTVAGLSGRSQDVADLRAMLARYEGDVAGIDVDNPPEEPLLHVADSAFVQPDSGVEPTFLERVGRFHGAHVYAADFAGGDAKPLLDAWVKDETGGLLDSCPVRPDAQTVLVLMDAVTFGASWRSPFDADVTSDAPFTRGDGTTVDVETMHQELGIAYAAEDGWVAAELPYTAGFAMQVLMPDEGAVPAGTWTAAGEALATGATTTVRLSMPTWRTDTTVDLSDALPELGLASLADPRGGLDGVFPDAYVAAVAQGATITVAEKGTVAAAVTAIGMAGSAAPQEAVELRLDHPFEYRVVEESTGLVLFAGRVADPSA